MSGKSKDTSGAAGTETGRGRVIQMEPGMQSIAMLPAMDEILDHLPSEAFDDLMMISTRGHPTDIEEAVLRADAEPSGVRVVPVTGSSVRYDGPLEVADRTGPNDLTSVGVKFNNGLRSIEGSDPWVVIDNFNIFLMYADENRVYRFMDTIVGNARQSGARGVYCTVRDAVEDQTYQRFRQLCDTEIDLR